MARIVRITSAIVLLVLLIQYPLVTIETGSLEYGEVDLTYPALALLSIGGIISEMFNDGSLHGLSELLKNQGGFLEDILHLQDMEQSTELNLLAFMLLLALAVFVAPTIGIFMSFFTRWGFVLVAIGMGVVSAVLFNAVGSYGEVTVTEYFYGMWGLTVLGIIAGGSGKRKKEDSK